MIRAQVPIYVTLEARDMNHALEQARAIQKLLDQATVHWQLRTSGVAAVGVQVMAPKPMR